MHRDKMKSNILDITDQSVEFIDDNQPNSPFSIEDEGVVSPLQQLNLIFTYWRNDKCLGGLDASELTISDDLLQFGTDKIIEEIKYAASRVYNQVCKLQIGDIEKCNDEIIRTLTEEDITGMQNV